VRNKACGIQLSLWTTYTTNGITATLLERLHAQQQGDLFSPIFYTSDHELL